MFRGPHQVGEEAAPVNHQTGTEPERLQQISKIRNMWQKVKIQHNNNDSFHHSNCWRFYVNSVLYLKDVKVNQEKSASLYRTWHGKSKIA